MRKRIVTLIAIGIVAVGIHAQENAHLNTLKEGVLQIRAAKSSSVVLNKMVIGWSAADCPKITLMDEIERDVDHEFFGSGANKFKANKVVTHVYSRQNTGMVSKGDYFNSTERDVFYSAIEKNIKKKATAIYDITGHVGPQEFVIISYNPKTKFTTKVNGKEATVVGEGVQTIKLPHVKPKDRISLSIANESGSDESFVILNFNPQK